MGCCLRVVISYIKAATLLGITLLPLRNSLRASETSRFKMKFLLVLALGLIAVQANNQLIDEFRVGNARFSANVYKEYLKTNSGDFMICPLSAEIVMGLVRTGAKGNTATQLSAGMQLPDDKEKVENTFAALISSFKGKDEYTLNSANKVYVKDGLKINDEFKNTAVRSFDADIENIDFAKSGAAAEINKWVEGKTENKIKNLLNDRDIDSQTASVLVNALFFQGTWQQKFKKSETHKKQFYSGNQKNVEVDMMKAANPFNYYESAELNAKFLEMPYEGHDVSMTIVLPNDKDGLSALEERVADVFTAPQYTKEKVLVELPKFKTETAVPLNDILHKFGIVDAFQPTADFSGISDDKRIYITKVVQKTFVEIDERGTTAAAATAAIAGFGSAPSRPATKQFIADHPFIYYIKSDAGVMFVGRYTGH